MRHGGNRPGGGLVIEQQTGWYTPKGGMATHGKTGANSMREHRLYKRLQAELRNGPERPKPSVADAPEAVAPEATPAKSKSGKRKERRRKSNKAQSEQAMQTRLAELQERFGSDYGD